MQNAALQLLDFSHEEPVTAMATVPPEIFRRRMTARILTDAEEAIHKLEQALLADNAGAAAAARYHLAALIAHYLHDDELLEKFLLRRNEAVAQSKAVQPMRHRKKRDER